MYLHVQFLALFLQSQDLVMSLYTELNYQPLLEVMDRLLIKSLQTSTADQIWPILHIKIHANVSLCHIL